jgi:glycosyltransferase involved in cell wall biosynthesis
MYEPLTVCIPVYNEASTIAGTLDSVLAQDVPCELEILVCANGCDDNTEEIVRIYDRAHSNVTLLTTSEKGKPNAWNLLRNAASHRYLVFMDGDVVVEPKALASLYKTLLRNPFLAAVGAMRVPHFKGLAPLARLLTDPPGPQECLYGCLYIIDNEKVSQRMSEHGQLKMQKNIINDDAWITAVTGENGWTTDCDAKVHYVRPGIKDYLAVSLRVHRGMAQLKTLFPNQIPGVNALPVLLRDTDASFLERIYQRTDILLATPGFKAKVGLVTRFFLGKPLERMIRKKIRERVANDKGDYKLEDVWFRPSSTKVTFQIPSSTS